MINKHKSLGINFINFCQSCASSQILSKDVHTEEIEFFCKSCNQAICRDCLLRYHLNLDIVPSSKKQ